MQADRGISWENGDSSCSLLTTTPPSVTRSTICFDSLGLEVRVLKSTPEFLASEQPEGFEANSPVKDHLSCPTNVAVGVLSAGRPLLNAMVGTLIKRAV